MTLRRWQSECIGQALRHYRNQQHFFCQATPAAGKTRMAAELAKLLFAEGKIDAVICFAPACQIVDGFRRTFTKVLGRAFDGRMNAAGTAITYQSIEHQEESFWRLFEELRVFTVFDEIHHCSGGDEVQSPNIWGQRIIQRIQDSATYTLAMSGTPWRSDERSIALARYSTPEGRLVVDYQYSLKDAIQEGVCRAPRVTLVDNSEITLKRIDNIVDNYDGFSSLLNSSKATFESLVTHVGINRQLLLLAQKRLNEIRISMPDAAALVVASNIDHAYKVSELLQQMDEQVVVVTTHRNDANQVIDDFRSGLSRWIVAVGMVSEGTDIPRLQVCCYLSRIRTEMYFRQVLGRVLRQRSKTDNQAWMYMLAEPELSASAERLMDDLPEHLAVCEHLVRVEVVDEAWRAEDGFHTSQSPGFDFTSLKPSARTKEPGGAASPAEQLGQMILLGAFREKLLAFF
ncbi:MAG: diguanylate cyclase [Thalassobium sp.]|jgi:superfamily II DNA or RNA helicase|nr:DEAD/DEAH box helicase family protein [Thalassolituus oleivorans]MAK92933.1 diguanylate cyclase [Thalassolituus sp.]MBQ0748149.1 DEAD/DEAH box helicase family protein [Marinobacter sp.]PHS65263.1 MAG: diguanylate cyclase [Thalassobium sp.]AHK16900.1 helicase [Thalassolituus oleivorans R6-15]APR68463.1 diguanylate cyclase [Thalassolituus oleivorans]|tara:strand:- start:2365 stop:3738 length:1374 start_codon:yes stop_codon:yes gene_type:complete